MKHTEDIVWDAITESAKSRFDYSEFESVFNNAGIIHLAENVLFIVIVGLGAEHSPDEIVAHVNRELAVLTVGFPEADLRRFIVERKADLKSEGLAMKVAMILFQEGAEPPAVLAQVRRFLAG